MYKIDFIFYPVKLLSFNFNTIIKYLNENNFTIEIEYNRIKILYDNNYQVIIDKLFNIEITKIIKLDENLPDIYKEIIIVLNKILKITKSVHKFKNNITIILNDVQLINTYNNDLLINELAKKYYKEYKIDISKEFKDFVMIRIYPDDELNIEKILQS